MSVKTIIPPLAIIFCLLSNMASYSQGVRGRVIDQEGNPLSFTTIFIPETGSGSVTNINGTYEIKLSPGTYNLNYQYLGYASTTKKVTVVDNWITLDVVLTKQAYTLNAAEIDGGKEDPAYKIMRKAIAKSSFHRQQVEKYTCNVYLKGGGRLVDYPWFM
ncbi:MAG: carboxypeptidase-like regulatory domain-containing protein, partial [Cryomorphaceae bacterium]